MDNSLKVDVRIIVSNLNISEVISKAIINANLESYNVIVSSETMEAAIELAVPLVADENAGQTWYEAK